jgi:quinol monooxygenase YgiN
MLVRIVRMHFLPEHTEAFTTIFDNVKSSIRSYPGCLYLELAQDTKEPTIFITYSQWDSEESLNDYRNSDFFTLVWQKTKVLFAENPQAFSYTSIHRLI